MSRPRPRPGGAPLRGLELSILRTRVLCMKIVITGGAGFLGQKLARRLIILDGIAARDDGVRRPIRAIVLVDQAAAPDLGDPRVETVAADIGDAKAMAAVIGPDADLVVHLAAVVSGAAASIQALPSTRAAGFVDEEAEALALILALAA